MTKDKVIYHWRDIVEVHPAADEFPMMAADELRALAEDIRLNGIREPLTRQGKRLVDGRNRMEGLWLSFGPMTDEEAMKPAIAAIKRQFNAARELKASVDVRPYTVSLNLHRRHLTYTQKRELLEKLLKADDAAGTRRSARQYAEAAGVGKTAAAEIVRELETKGEVSATDTRTGKDGVAQPAAKPKKIKVEVTKTAILLDGKTGFRLPDDSPEAEEWRRQHGYQPPEPPAAEPSSPAPQAPDELGVGSLMDVEEELAPPAPEPEQGASETLPPSDGAPEPEPQPAAKRKRKVHNSALERLELLWRYGDDDPELELEACIELLGLVSAETQQRFLVSLPPPKPEEPPPPAPIIAVYNADTGKPFADRHLLIRQIAGILGLKITIEGETPKPTKEPT